MSERPSKEQVDGALRKSADIRRAFAGSDMELLYDGASRDQLLLALEVVALRDELRQAYDNLNYPENERDMVHCYPHRTRWNRLAYSTGCPACLLEKELAECKAKLPKVGA